MRLDLVIHSPFALAFTHGARVKHALDGPIEIETRVLGELRVPSGKLVVSDPFVTSFDEKQKPLARKAPTGVFPVEVAIAHFDSGDQRVACARVRFRSSAPAVKWTVARFKGQKVSADHYPGYGVDAGTGCFFDQRARAEVDEATSAAWIRACEANYVHTWHWHVADLGRANVVMFSSGLGDGFYSSHWGFDQTGELVELVTDFELLIEPIQERVELPLPLPRRRVSHPLLAEHDVTVRGALLSRNKAVLGGSGDARLELTDPEIKIQMSFKGKKRHYSWSPPAPGSRLVVWIMVGMKPVEAA